MKYFLMVILIIALCGCNSQSADNTNIVKESIPSPLQSYKISPSFTPLPMLSLSPSNSPLPFLFPIPTLQPSKKAVTSNSQNFPNTQQTSSSTNKNESYYSGDSGSSSSVSVLTGPMPPVINLTPTTIPATSDCQEWFCDEYFGKLWMGKCCDENKDGIFEMKECTGKTPAGGYIYPKDCQGIPTPTPAPVVGGGCSTYFCTVNGTREESGKCCDTNKNGVYEPSECTGKTPFNGYADNTSHCAS